MPLHLLKLSVGVRDISHLEALQDRRRRELGRLIHFTRQMPRRGEELLAGGSIYWVIKGVIRVRQAFLGIEAVTDREGRALTALILDSDLVRVAPRAQKAFQGWRYMTAEQAPRDLAEQAEGLLEMPPAMLAELRELGLI